MNIYANYAYDRHIPVHACHKDERYVPIWEFLGYCQANSAHEIGTGLNMELSELYIVTSSFWQKMCDGALKTYAVYYSPGSTKYLSDETEDNDRVYAPSFHDLAMNIAAVDPCWGAPKLGSWSAPTWISVYPTMSNYRASLMFLDLPRLPDVLQDLVMYNSSRGGGGRSNFISDIIDYLLFAGIVPDQEQFNGWDSRMQNAYRESSMEECTIQSNAK